MRDAERSQARDAAAAWIKAVDTGDSGAIHTAEQRLENIVGPSAVPEWKYYATLMRWAENRLDLQLGEQVYTEKHPGLAQMQSRDKLLQDLLDNFRGRLSEGSIRAACSRALRELDLRRHGLARDIECLERTRTAEHPELVGSRSRLRMLDRTMDQVRTFGV